MSWRCMFLGHVADDYTRNTCKLCKSFLPSIIVDIDDAEISAAFDEGYRHAKYVISHRLHCVADDEESVDPTKAETFRQVIDLVRSC